MKKKGDILSVVCLLFHIYSSFRFVVSFPLGRIMHLSLGMGGSVGGWVALLYG